MADWQQDHAPFHNAGMSLAVPVDKLSQGKHRYLRNVRPFGDGQIHGRQGVTPVSQGAVPVAAAIHSLKRFDDPVADPERLPNAFLRYNRLAGVSTSLLAAASDTQNPANYIAVNDLQQTPAAPVVFSGDPLTWAIASSDYSARPFVFIGDSLLYRKYTSAIQTWQIGVAHPDFAPNVASNGTTSQTVVGTPDEGTNGGPDIGDTLSPYLYRLVARSDPEVLTNHQSNAGPAIRALNGWYVGGTDPGLAFTNYLNAGTHLRISVDQAHPDEQVAWLDVYRFGGSLPAWIYIGSMRNTVGAFMIDSYADIDIASNPTLSFDNYQPFLTIGPSRAGICQLSANGVNGAGSTLTVVSGSNLLPYEAALGEDKYDVPGNQILINGRAFTFYRSPDSATSVELVEDLPNAFAGTPLDWTMPAPESARTPLQRVFGPWGGGQAGEFIFAVGDPNRPGALYWTVGNRPEGHSASGVLDITSASEPLMNGVIFDGTAYVFSTERMFRIYPSFGEVSTFTAVEVTNSPGMFSKWGIAVGPKIWIIRRDGIYEFEPGQEPVNITDPDLYPLFTHESTASTAFPTPDGLTDITLNYPDFDTPDSLRLCYSRDGYLYFDFYDTAGTYRTLVYDTNPSNLQHRGGWVSIDDSTPNVTLHYAEEGEDNRQLLMGATDGRVYNYSGQTDGGGSISCHIRSAARDQGNPRARFHYGDIELDYDSDCQAINAKAGFDDFSYFSVLATGFVRRIGYRRSVLDIEGGKGQYAFNIGIDIQWSQVDGIPKFNFWEPSYLIKPVLSRKRVTDWTSAEYDGAKFVQGFVMKADTLGQDRTVAVHGDDGTVQQSFTVTHSGEQEVAYSFTTPFITHLLRMHPTDDDYWRIFNVRWIWEPAPELVQYWETQEGSWECPGFFHHRDCYIPVISNGAGTLTVKADGTEYDYTISDPGNAYAKQYIVLQPMKCKYASYKITGPSTGIRVFQKDVTIRKKCWGSDGPYEILQPFGDLSRVNGARI